MKKLKDFLEVYKPKSPDEQKFVDKHVVIKHKDRNGNGDDVFKADNIKTNKRKEERHGYDVGEDEKVYEEVEVSEDTFTDASLANLRVMKHKQEMKKIESSSKIHPLMKVRRLSDAKKHLTSLEADRDRLAAKHEKAMSRKKKVNEDIILDELLDEALDMLLSMDEKTLTPAEIKKREEVVKAIKRGDPKMDKSMAYAIATKTAKKVAEGAMPTADEPTDANKRMAQKVRDLLAKEKKPVKEDVDSYADALIKRNKNNLHKAHVTNAARIAGVDEKELMAAVNKKVGRIKEEAEDLDELSVKTLDKYRSKARKDIIDTDDSDENRINKRAGGYLAASRQVAKKLAKEEIELDELSVTTLKNYRTKARADAYDADDVDDERRYRKRAAGSNTSGKKIVRQGGNLGEEAELEESAKVVAHLVKRYGNNIRKSHVMSAANDFGVGYTGLSRMVRKKLGVTRLEEDEQIDELSTKKLTDYTAAATDARGHRGVSTAKLDKRYQGVMRAGDKINKGFSKVHATEEAELEEGMAMWKVDFPKQHAGKLVAAGSTHVKAQNVAHAHKVMAKRLGVDHTLLKAKVTKSSILPEEAEAIDELSKSTMGRYVNKAKDQIDAASWRTGFRQGSKPNADTTNDNVIKAKEKQLSKRHKGIETAVKKLTREEAEGLDELSKKTLGSYVKKASGAERPKNVMSPKSVPITTVAAYQGDSETGHFGKRFNQSTYDKAERLRKNRETGIKTAVDKLTKEDIINRAIEKYVPEDVKFTPEERLLKRLEGLSESHIDTIVGLFEQLNSDNKLKMIESVESYEGINQILNFALENRGE